MPVFSTFPPSAMAVLLGRLSRAMARVPKHPGRRGKLEDSGGLWEPRHQYTSDWVRAGRQHSNAALQAAKFPWLLRFPYHLVFHAWLPLTELPLAIIRKTVKRPKEEDAQVKVSFQDGCQVVPPLRRLDTIWLL
jgi:hypothetical protein